MCMVTKTITILEDAYQLLADRKLADESFSEEIMRLLSKKGQKDLSSFFGILSDKEGENMIEMLEKKRTAGIALKRKKIQELYT